jgi:hypothetical protein
LSGLRQENHGGIQQKKMTMKLGLTKLFIIIVLILTTGSVGFTEVEWNIVQTLKLEAPPLDMAVSPDGRRIYVLVEGGSVLIYSSRGILKEKIQVGNQVDQIGWKCPHIFQQGHPEGKNPGRKSGRSNQSRSKG